MMLRKVIGLLLYVALVTGQISAQSVEQDMLKISQNYKAQFFYAYHATYSFYKKAGDVSPALIRKDYVSKKGHVIYRVQDSVMETISDSDRLLVVNHREKRISLTKKMYDTSTWSMDGLTAETISELLKNAKQVNSKQESNNLMSYVIVFNDDQQYRELRITYSSKDYFFREIVLVISETMGGGKVSMQFSPPAFKKQPNKTVNDFLQLAGGHFLPVEAFSAYRFYNLYSIPVKGKK